MERAQVSAKKWIYRLESIKEDDIIECDLIVEDSIWKMELDPYLKLYTTDQLKMN